MTEFVPRDECGRDQIGVESAVQPHGVLAVCDAHLRVQQVSASLEPLLGLSLDLVLGQSADGWFDDSSADELRRCVQQGCPPGANPVAVTDRAGRAWDAVLHQPPGDSHVVLELETASPRARRDTRVRHSLARLHRSTSVQTLLDRAAEEVRRLTAFDRVTVCLFDERPSGDAAPGCPSADCPPRRRHQRDSPHFVPDVSYRPSPLVPAQEHSIGRPLDLTHAVLAGVPPGRLERLRAAGVRAWMSIPLVDDDRLIGLMLCHHHAGPHAVPFVTRDACTLIGDFVAWRLSRMRADEATTGLWRAQQAQTAAELRALQARLDATERGREEFVATVSHELRTPLTSILGWTRLIHDGAVDERQRRRGLEAIERNAKAQVKVIDELLDVTGTTAGTMTLNVEPVAISTVVDRALDAVMPAADVKNLQLNRAVDSSAIVMGDPRRLVQVLTSLLSNAVRFTPPQGRVDIVAERREAWVDVRVTDTGPGIDAGLLPRVFEGLHHGDAEPVRGTSRPGLAIARSLVELHGGTLDAASDGAGRGASFIVRLPLSAAARRSPEAPASENVPRPPPLLDGLTVLVVDDEPDARELLETMFGACGSHVVAVGSAQEALELVQELRPDVLVSDLGMPGMDGYRFIEAVRQLPEGRGGRTPAVALSAYARVEDRARAMVAGFQAHVPKPVEPVELLAVVGSLVAGRAPRDDQRRTAG